MRTIDERVAYFRLQNWYSVANLVLKRDGHYDVMSHIRSWDLSPMCVFIPLAWSGLPYPFYKRAERDYDNFQHSI